MHFPVAKIHNQVPSPPNLLTVSHGHKQSLFLKNLLRKLPEIFRSIGQHIKQIEQILKNAEVVDEDEVDLDKINIGCLVRVLDIEYDEEEEYKLVGSSEASSLQNKVSNESPFGKALIGAKVGDIVEVEAPAGIVKYKVLSIHRAN